MTGKIFRYFVSTIGGLEEVVLADLRRRLSSVKQIRVEKGSRYGRIFFTYTHSPRRLLDLRASEGCSAVLDELNGVTVGNPGLEYVIRRLSRIDLAPAIRLADSLSHSGARGVAGAGVGLEERKFQLGVTMSGSHRFSRSELTRRVQNVLISLGMRLSDDESSLRFQLQLRGKRALLSLRLPVERRASAFVYRGQLDGPLVHCLGLLLGLGNDDAVIATCCAAGALVEIATAGQPRLLVGLNDGGGGICRSARPSAITPPVEAGGHWVSTGIDWPIRDGSADCVLGVAAAADTSGLNLGECSRVLYPGAIAGVLAARPAEFIQTLEEMNLPFEILASVPIYLKARKHQFFVLERLEEVPEDEDLLQIDQAV